MARGETRKSRPQRKKQAKFDGRKLAASPISAVDLFCGAGGLTHGLLLAGIDVAAGIDADGSTKHAYTANNARARFLKWNVTYKTSSQVRKLFDRKKYRLLAGCAPCQPFSKLTNGIERHRSWDLLDNFARYIKKISPDLVTMENVPELAYRGSEVFDHFRETLENRGYHVDWDIVNCKDYGAPQSRKRLVLVASLLGEIKVPKGRRKAKTVRTAIGKLAKLSSGETDPADPLHTAALLSPLNLQRVRATPHDGGTKDAWPKRLLLDCHQTARGARYHSIYGRMWWNRPAPTMTTLCNGIGNGRFGHPEQDRAITLREAALLQSFPPSYEFWPENETLNRKAVARMIGNAVPPALGRALGKALLDHVRAHEKLERPAKRRRRSTA
jgi:DNA (cytosine-5)-methyltransferase 1